jgi:anti-sigma regulatory factor (Ser/Thr protein kinase)
MLPEKTPWPAAAEQASEPQPPLDDVIGAAHNLHTSTYSNSTGSGSLLSERLIDSQFAKWDVPISDRAPAQVRRWATGHLTRWGATDAIEDATTVLTELVTNTCQAEATRMAVLIEPDAGPNVIEVCVWDNAPGVPQKREPDFCTERGRGLLMVDALATRWGHHPLALEPGRLGKVVWAHIAGSGNGA